MNLLYDGPPMERKVIYAKPNVADLDPPKIKIDKPVIDSKLNSDIDSEEDKK